MIASAEKIKVEPDALLAIARGCEGGLRDALSALDQLVSFKGADIKEEDVLSVFGLASRSMLENMAGAVLRGDIKSVIELVAALDESGKDFQRFIIELMGHFRNLMVWIHVQDASCMELVTAQVDALKTQSAMTNAERVIRITDILGETENRMKYALSKRTLLETALIRCARAATVVSIEEILRQINALKDGIGEGIAGTVRHEDMETKGRGDVEAGKTVTGNRRDGETGAGKQADPESELKMLKENWRTVVDKAGAIAVGCKSMLLDARPLAVAGNKVTIGFDPEFADEVETMKVPRNRMAVEHTIGAMLKRTVVAEYCLSDTVAQDRLADNPKAVKSHSAQTGSATEKGKPKNKRELIDDPAVQKALDVLDGTILDVRE
jgi:DNA polymerase-3 subunit gamma/tau